MVTYVVHRDGGICHLCGQPGADSADHIIPRSHGGPDDVSNLRAVHHNAPPRCNRVRGAGDIATARAKLTPPSEGPGWSW